MKPLCGVRGGRGQRCWGCNWGQAGGSVGFRRHVSHVPPPGLSPVYLWPMLEETDGAGGLGGDPGGKPDNYLYTGLCLL